MKFKLVYILLFISFALKANPIKIDSISCDFNNDNFQDLIIIEKIESINSIYFKISFSLFESRNKKYLRIFENNEFIKLDNNGLDNLGEITIDKNLLNIKVTKYYGPSTHYLYSYKFRYENNLFRLIGTEIEFYNQSTGEGENTSINFLINKYTITTLKNGAKKKTRKGRFNAVQLNLQNIKQLQTNKITEEVEI